MTRPGVARAHGAPRRVSHARRPAGVEHRPVHTTSKGCVCGSSCPACKAEEDRLEREAGTAAENVLGARPAGIAAPSPPDMPEPGSEASGSAFRGRGEPLPPKLNAFFSRGFGRNFGKVRLHHDADAGAQARAMGARAFSLGQDIAFAPGAYRPDSRAGRQLIAHELAHTLQKGADRTARRSAEGKEPEPGKWPQTDITMEISENPTGIRRNRRMTNFRNGNFAYYRTVYPRDSLHFAVSNMYENQPVSDLGLARVETQGSFAVPEAAAGGEGLVLRVLAEPEQEIDTRIYLASPDVEGEMEVVFKIGVVPLDIDPVEDVRKRSKQEKKALRRDQKSERKKLRSDKRAGDENRDFRAERKAMRKRQRDERRDLKEKRKSGIEATRETRKAEIEDSLSENGKYACTKNQRQNVSAAMNAAIDKLRAALGNIKPAEAPDKFRAEVLSKAFNIDVPSTSPDEIARLQQKAVDILNIARTSMLLSNPSTVRCGAPPGDCKPTTAAFVEDNVRGNPVTVCKVWLDDNMTFEATRNESVGQRAYALIHEFIHLAGVKDQTDETYLHEGGWEGIPPKEAETMADAFAYFAWKMGSPGLD